MIIKEYLSIQQSIDLVFELTGEKINGSDLEELSNVEKLTPVFLFSGYVSYPDINYKTIPYDKMKAYFTHNDFFMHQTKNYEAYSMYGDADVGEWIEIHSPFTIQKIIKQQSKAYNVFDEVFLFRNPPIGEVDKLDDLKCSHIGFDEVRFSRDELIALFNVRNSYVNAQNEFEFYMNAAKTIRDSVTSDINARNDLIEPIGSQRLLISYVLFTPHEITCLLSNSNPAYTHNDNDKYNAYKDMVSKAIDAKALNPINDKEQIPAEQIKSWLARYNFIIRGFNDNLSNDTDKIPAQNDSELLTNLEKLQAENDDLNSRLKTARNTYKQHRSEIKELKALLEKTNADNTDLNEQLKNRIDASSNVDELKGIAKLNIEKPIFISSAKAIANYLWSLDKSEAIRTGDMVQQVKAIMINVNYDLLPSEDETIRTWLAEVAPPHAKKSGRTPKNAPSEITLIMKK